ncbi:hypothetical protein ACFQU2_18855 [Siccirubricoccus deserti]
MADTEAQRLVADVNALLRLKTTIIGMQLFETVEEMEAIPASAGRRHATPPTRSSAWAPASAGPSASPRMTWSARNAAR